MNKHFGARALGVIVGIFLALVAAGICAGIVRGARGYDGIGQLVLVVLFGIPLLILNIVFTFYLQNRDATHGKILRWMWLPTVAVCLIAFAYTIITQTIAGNYQRAHPPITEIHVNLSGRAFWLAPEVDEVRYDPALFSRIRRERTPQDHDDPMTEYVGVQLAPGFKSLTIRTGEPNGVTQARVPVVVLPGPDLKLVAPAFASSPPGVAYMYYHYPDRIDIAPTLDVYEGYGRRQPSAHVPLVYVYAHNLTPSPIARLEIDGLTLQLIAAIKPASEEGSDCKIAHAAAINRLAAPLKVRWQAAQAAPAWQTATVAVPSLAPIAPGAGSVREIAVHLYFLPDGSVSAQRAEDVAGSDGELEPDLTAGGRTPNAGRLRVSDIEPALKSPPPCGDATKAYRKGQ